MMSRLIARIVHRERTERTESVIHALRDQTQIAELQRHTLQKARENADLTWLEAALTPRRLESTHEQEGVK